MKISGDEVALKFINDNLDKIWLKPQVYQHGDFLSENLILTPDGKFVVIDFNHWEIGDPYEEFYKLESFRTEVSSPYY
ncbi:phosphotransferase [Acetobacterium paludosum]|uniref:Phosphotransferase n=1 Tax=Acetobacterium paludosum TaxID=52693 RepID=A0A923KXJ2_9FIRM|nr:phosphotransferase [Acetobacterium paludosum]MBC3889413.1 phosphotransferase [Acetobacterium paludosum]